MNLDYTLEKLKKETEEIINMPATIENIGHFLCGGANWELAKEPFSKEFLCNVAYNHSRCYEVVMFLQLTHLKKGVVSTS